MPKDILDRKFIEYYKENPKVWDLFKRFTFEVIKAKHNHYSADAIFHRIRWHTSVESKGDDFKINNNYISRYARLFHKKYPEYSNFFRTRKLKRKKIRNQ